jgi:GT2 family glycosyltransferase
VLAELPGRVAVLLNNDIKLDEDAIDPLVEPLLADQPAGAAKCFMTAPRCWLFDGKTHEGLQAAVRWHWGLVEATAYFAGHEQARRRRGLTAAAGPVMAVDRRLFLELGGFDPLYLPGRLEDLDFAFRGYMAGYEAQYVPEAVSYHKGQASFNAAFGPAGSDALALRNTLLFQWKNLRRPGHWLRHLIALPARFALDCLRAPITPRESRWSFAKALCSALQRVRGCWRSSCAPRRAWSAERAFFRSLSAAGLAAGHERFERCASAARYLEPSQGREGSELLTSVGGPPQ